MTLGVSGESEPSVYLYDSADVQPVVERLQDDDLRRRVAARRAARNMAIDAAAGIENVNAEVRWAIEDFEKLTAFTQGEPWTGAYWHPKEVQEIISEIDAERGAVAVIGAQDNLLPINWRSQ